jgi:hypothetical protein
MAQESVVHLGYARLLLNEGAVRICPHASHKPGIEKHTLHKQESAKVPEKYNTAQEAAHQS